MSDQPHVNIPWLEVLGALGLQSAARILPTTLGCPLCQSGQVAVYHDSAYGGGWFHCARCQFAGDAVEFAARVWRTTPVEAFHRLVASGIIAPTPGLDATYLENCRGRDTYRTFWDAGLNDFTAAQRYFPDGALGATPDAWRKRVKLGQRATLVRAFRGALRHWIELPRHWKEFALMPLEDLPGRPRGLLAIRDRDSRVISDPLCTHSMALGVSALRDSRADFLILTESIETALELQLTSLRELQTPAPICGLKLRPAGLAPFWRQLRKDLVFWAPNPTPNLFREAALCDAVVSLRNPLPPGLTVTGRLATLCKSVKPWPHALVRHLEKLQESAAVEFAAAIGLPADLLQEFLDSLPPRLARTLAALRRGPTDTCYYGGMELLRRGTEIFHKTRKGKEALVSDTTMLLRRIIDGADPIYEGEVQFRRRSFRFSVPASELEPDPEPWLRRQFWRQAIGIPFIAANWRPHYLQLAQLFGNAEIVSQLPPVGWSTEADGLVLNSWTVRRGGKVTVWPTQRKLRVGRVPAPNPLSPAALGHLSRQVGRSAFWAVLAVVAGSVLSRVLGRRPADLMLLGRGARLVGGLTAKLCGCPNLRMDREHSRELHEALQDSARANWPALLWASYAHTSVATLLPPDRQATIIYRTLYDLPGVGLAIDNDCDLVDIADIRGGTTALERYGADVLPAYLQDLARRNFALRPSEQPTADVMSDMLRWWRRIGGDANVQRRYFADATKWRQCMHRLLVMGRSRLASVHLGFAGKLKGAKVPIETDPKFMYFPRERFRAAYAHRVHLDMLKLGAGLRRTGYLHSDPRDPVWVLPISFWENVVTTAGRARLPH
jgi:hypothetical protein